MSAATPKVCPKCGAKRRGDKVWHDRSCPARHTAALEHGTPPATGATGTEAQR